MAVNFKKIHVDNVIETTAKQFVSAAEKTAIAGAAQKASNLSDLANAGTARDNLGLGTAAVLDTGTAVGDIPILGAGGKLAESIIPALAISETVVVADLAARNALTPGTGDVAVVSDIGVDLDGSGSNDSATYIWSGAVWIEMLGDKSTVSSVAGRTGAIVLTKADVGLSAVDNTSDADKPISTATSTALGLKVDSLNPVFTGTITGIDAADVGLGSVDNTSDADKPVSTAQLTALNAKLDDSQLDVADDLGAGASSDTKIASQLAVKTYVDAQVSSSSPGVTVSLPLTVAAGVITLAGAAQGVTSIYVDDEGLLLNGWTHIKGASTITVDVLLNGKVVYVTYLDLA